MKGTKKLFFIYENKNGSFCFYKQFKILFCVHVGDFRCEFSGLSSLPTGSTNLVTHQLCLPFSDHKTPPLNNMPNTRWWKFDFEIGLRNTMVIMIKSTLLFDQVWINSLRRIHNKLKSPLPTFPEINVAQKSRAHKSIPWFLQSKNALSTIFPQ